MKRTDLGRAALVLAMGLAAVGLGLFGGCRSQQAGGDVVAKVNGRKILRSEVETYYQNQTVGAPQQPTNQEQAESLRLSILKELIDNEIMMQRAEKLGLLASDEEVDSKLAELKANSTQEEFNKRLQDKHITVDDLKRDLRRSLTIEKVLNKEITSKITITDADITKYYNDHKAEFNLIEPQYHVALIWVSPDPNPQVHNLKNSKAQNDAEAKDKMKMILNRLDSGEDFASVAMNYSEDPESANNGGDLGLFPESALQRVDSGTREAISRMKAGQISGIIAVNLPQRGYRIVKLISKEPAGQRELNDPRVQQAIREQIRQRDEQLLKSAYYEVIRDQAKVENFYAEQVLRDAGGVQSR